MAAVAGWYPDPDGDTTRLRYWDGTQWTDNYTPVPAQTANTTQNATVNPEQAAPAANAQAVPTAPQAPTYAAPADPMNATSNMEYQRFDPEQIYPMTSQDRTLRLIAFVLNVLSCVGFAMFIIPLAWMIPMTVMSWNIYKGKRANTVAFGVCTLIFLDLISGILLLVSHKDQPQY